MLRIVHWIHPFSGVFISDFPRWLLGLFRWSARRWHPVPNQCAAVIIQSGRRAGGAASRGGGQGDTARVGGRGLQAQDGLYVAPPLKIFPIQTPVTVIIKELSIHSFG